MSKFLKRQINSEEPDSSSDLEEQYERLFPKIGRDFVSKEDMDGVLQKIISIIDPTGLLGLSLDDSSARAKAHEYKHNIENGKDISKKYKDLCKIDEE